MSKRQNKTNYCVPTCLHALTGLSKKRFARLFYELRDPWWTGGFQGLYHTIKYLKSFGYEGYVEEYTPEALNRSSPTLMLMNKEHAVVAKHIYGKPAIIVDTTLQYTLDKPTHIFYLRKRDTTK